MVARAPNMPVAPNQNSPIILVPVQQSDLDNLVAIRIEAMRESLERVGRFDPVRARERFVGGFEARDTRYIEASGERVGFVVVKHHPNELLLDHLYVRPGAQGSRFRGRVCCSLSDFQRGGCGCAAYQSGGSQRKRFESLLYPPWLPVHRKQ